jgi:MFS family permease
MALYILYATRYLHVTPFEWGVILGPSSLGALLASALAGRFGRRVGLGRTLLLGVLLYTVPYLLIPLAGGPHLLVVATLFLAEGLAAGGSMIREVASGTIQAASIPDELRARAMAGFVAVGTGIRPLGALAAGLLAAALGVHLTIWFATAGAALSSSGSCRCRCAACGRWRTSPPVSPATAGRSGCLTVHAASWYVRVGPTHRRTDRVPHSAREDT